MTKQHHDRQFPGKKPEILVDYREKFSGLPDALVAAGFETNIDQSCQIIGMISQQSTKLSDLIESNDTVA